MIRDRIEIEQIQNSKGDELIRFNLHTKDLGVIWIRDVPFSKGIKDYFCRPRNINELTKYRHGPNKALNKIVDRMPAYIKYAREEAELDKILDLESKVIDNCDYEHAV